MIKHAKVKGTVLALAVALTALLVACSGSQSSGSASTASSNAASGAATASSSVSAGSSSIAAAGAEDVVTIGLDYNAGTGYEWKCAIEPEGTLTLVNQETEDLASDKEMAGGPLREKFTLRAAKPGEATVTFTLTRNWEGDPAETQVYAFTVTDDLKMVLNPYKSNFTNEPEWGSNS